MKSYDLAKLMRGGTSFDENYLETYVPEEILNKMHETYTWIDDDGFTWGFPYVFAGVKTDSHDGETFVCLAQKYMGMGCAEHKCIFPPCTDVQVIVHYA